MADERQPDVWDPLSPRSPIEVAVIARRHGIETARPFVLEMDIEESGGGDGYLSTLIAWRRLTPQAPARGERRPPGRLWLVGEHPADPPDDDAARCPRMIFRVDGDTITLLVYRAILLVPSGDAVVHAQWIPQPDGPTITAYWCQAARSDARVSNWRHVQKAFTWFAARLSAGGRPEGKTAPDPEFAGRYYRALRRRFNDGFTERPSQAELAAELGESVDTLRRRIKDVPLPWPPIWPPQ
jgi:hypothetical protein